MSNSEADNSSRLLMPPVKLYRFSGGLRLILDDNRRCHLLGARPGQELHFDLGNRVVGPSLFNNANFRPFARSTCYTDEELNDPIADVFALAAWGPDRKSLTFSQEFYWSGVSHVFNEEGKSVEEGLVRRLTTSMRKCLRRFEKLFLSYSTALKHYGVKELLPGNFVRDKYASDIGNEFGSFLDDLYGLRDSVNAITYRILLNGEGAFSTKKFRQLILRSEKDELIRTISESMFEEASGDLMLSRMSTYRAVALHCMGTTNPILGDSVCFVKESTSFGNIVRMVFPLYDDMAKLKETELETPRGFSFKRDEAELRRFTSLDAHNDAMEFGFDCYVRLLTICRLLGERLGLKSEHMRLTDDDIIDFDLKTAP